MSLMAGSTTEEGAGGGGADSILLEKEKLEKLREQISSRRVAKDE